VRLSRQGRELYTLELTATDAAGTPIVPTGWDASFDRGVTWVAGTKNVSSGWWEWLVAGPDFPAAVDVPYVTLTAGVLPLGRLTDNPEVIIRDWPRINLF
jgi:hypothetical protein